MSKFLQCNINELNKLKRNSTQNANNATKKRVDEIVKLYTERKLSNVATAENYVKGLTSTDKKAYDKAFQKYKDNIKKIKDTKPLNERMAEARANNKKKEGGGGKYRKINHNEYIGSRGRKKDTYFVRYDLCIIGDKKKMKSKPAFKAFDEYYYERLSATVDIGEEFPKEFIRKRILKKNRCFDGY